MTETAVVAGRGDPTATRLPLMRRAMIRQMVLGAAVPCFYLRVTADLTDLLAVRAELKAAAGSGPVPSVNDFIVRAAALTLCEHPEVNSSYSEDEIVAHPRINVGVAVAVPGGLVVPAVYDADRLSLSAIAGAVRELVELAGRRKLGRDVLSDATFTISNLGMFGIEEFDPILNPPQAAILAVGAAQEGGDGRRRVRLTLGCDHRVLTGAEGAPFLTAIRARLQEPAALVAPADNDHQPE